MTQNGTQGPLRKQVMPTPPKGKPLSPPQLTDVETAIAEVEYRYEELNSKWKSAEALLKKFVVPSEVRVKVDAVEDHSRGGEELAIAYLGWAKHHGTWKICYGWLDVNDPNDEVGWKPILDCTLDVRIQNIKYFPDLKDRVEKRMRELIPELDDALAKFDDMLAG